MQKIIRCISCDQPTTNWDVEVCDTCLADVLVPDYTPEELAAAQQYDWNMAKTMYDRADLFARKH